MLPIQRLRLRISWLARVRMSPVVTPKTRLMPTPNGKSPLITPLLRQMVEVLPDYLPRLRDKVLLLIGFAGAFQRSELVGLQVREIQTGDAGLIVMLRRSKADQEGASFTKGIPVGRSDARFARQPYRSE